MKKETRVTNQLTAQTKAWDKRYLINYSKRKKNNRNMHIALPINQDKVIVILLKTDLIFMNKKLILNTEKNLLEIGF